jgi:hypothetical protein
MYDQLVTHFQVSPKEEIKIFNLHQILMHCMDNQFPVRWLNLQS